MIKHNVKAVAGGYEDSLCGPVFLPSLVFPVPPVCLSPIVFVCVLVWAWLSLLAQLSCLYRFFTPLILQTCLSLAYQPAALLPRLSDHSSPYCCFTPVIDALQLPKLLRAFRALNCCFCASGTSPSHQSASLPTIPCLPRCPINSTHASLTCLPSVLPNPA